jgi:simple sugar transport system permease protein
MLKKIIKTNEFFVAMILIALCLLIGILNPAFFTLQNFFDLCRSATVMGIFAMGALIVIISGGVDVSFTAIAISAMYITVKILLAFNFTGTVVVAIVLSAFIGLIMGLINAAIIAFFKIPTLIATLGTQSLFQGFLLFFIGSKYINNVPEGMLRFARTNLVTTTTPTGAITGLQAGILILVGVSLLVWFILRFTMIGRGIYALGGSREASERAGFNVIALQFFIYAFVGVLAGIGGAVFGSHYKQANPFDLVGTELNTIAAVVLGGALITGGRGTVIGTILGVSLVVVINNSLVLIGVPSEWQKVVLGVILIIGAGVPAYKNMMAEKRLKANLSE